MSIHIRHDLQLLHASLLTGKLPRNLNWADAVELIGKIGEVQPHGNDESLLIVGAQRAFFKHPHFGELGVEDVSRLRKLLRDAAPEPRSPVPGQPCRMVVVIDHHVAHVYQDFNKNLPVAEETIRPYDPFGFQHHLVHKQDDQYKGERVPEETSFYEEVAKDLRSADEIVLIGHGTGKSNAMQFLAEYLKTHHPEVSRRVIATETTDLSALTASEIEAIAKHHMIALV